MALLGHVLPNLEFILFGTLATTAGILNLRLPETLGMELPETIEDLVSLHFEDGSTII